jgi:hypothetical protein
MSSPEAALGIYLHQAGSGDPLPEIEARNAGGPYQITVLRGAAFIQINSFSGADSLLAAMSALASACLTEFPATEPEPLLDILPEAGRVAGSERLVRGPVALQPVFTFGPGDILSLDGRIFGALARYATEDGDEYSLLRIRYRDAAEARAAYALLLEKLDPYLDVLSETDVSFVFEDYRRRYGVVVREDSLLELRFNLIRKPTG